MASVMSQACERCWRRKQKCDRRRPVCLQCESASAVCVERRRGTTVDPSDPTAHLSYIEALKHKVQLLEARVEQSPPHQSHNGASPSNHPGLGPDHGPPRDDRSAAGPVGWTMRQGDSIQAEMGYLSLAAMAEFTGEQPSSSQTISFLSFQTLFRSSTGVSASNPSRSDIPNPAIVGSLGDFHRGLLRQGLHLTSVETQKPFQRYLDMSMQCFPFVDRTQLTEEYALVVQCHETDDFGNLLADSPGKAIRVYAAVSTGILLSSDYRHMESFATILTLTAYQHMPRVLASANELETVQCLVAVAIFSLFSTFGGSTWHLLGLAMTRCISAGMHHVRVSDPQSDDGGKKGCSRVFWCLYVLDALVSSSLDRPFFIQDEDVTTMPPSLGSCLGEELDEFHGCIVQFARLLREARRNPAKGALFHFSNLRHCRETLPASSSRVEGGLWLRDSVCSRLCCCALLEILPTLTSSQSMTETTMVVRFSEQEFLRCLSLLEEQAAAQKCAFMGSDGLIVFCIGVELICSSILRRDGGSDASRQARATFQAISKRCLHLLILISVRFTSVRSLQEILSNFVTLLASESHSDGVDWPVLERRIVASDIPVPSRAQGLMQSALALTPAHHLSSGQPV